MRRLAATIALALVLAACSSEPRARPPAPAMTNRPGPPPSAGACTAPFVVEPPYPDAWVDQSAAAAASAGGVWPTDPMRGPAATFELAAPGCTETARVAAAPPFDEIVLCRTGDPKRPLGYDNIPVYQLALHSSRGWWSYEVAREYWPHGDPDDEARVADVDHLTAGDRLGDAAAEVTAIAEDGPPGGAKTRTVFLCGAGASQAPSCARLRVAANGPFHGRGSLLYRLTLACTGALDLAGWEGGDSVGLVHASYSLAFP